MSSIREMSGITMSPLPRLLSISTNVTVVLPLVNPNGGICTVGMPPCMWPEMRNFSVLYFWNILYGILLYHDIINNIISFIIKYI